MSFFTNGTAVGEVETLDQLMENKSIQINSHYEDFIEEAYAIVAEATENENRLMMAIGINESTYYAQTGEEFVYTEGVLGDIWSKIKEIVLKIWNKIKALFKRFVAMFDKFFASDKSFVKKYKSRILSADTSDLEYDGYTFPHIETGIKAVNPDSYESKIKVGEEDNTSEIVEAYRAAMLSQSGTLTDSEFASELKEFFYGDKESLSNISLSTEISWIENTEKVKKAIEKAKKDMDKVFKDIIKAIDDESKRTDKEITNSKADDPNNKARANWAQYVSRCRTFYTGISAAYSKAYGVYLQAVKDRNRQARAICVKAMVKGKKFSNESASFEYPAYGSNFLEQVKFI